jgi:hypothetical protein
MASLFGEFQLRETASAIDIPEMQEKIAILQEWATDYHDGSLRADNETAREQAYNHAIFKSVLGYSEKPSSPYTFEPKSSTTRGLIPDARIGYFDSANEIERTLAVVELKGASTSLDRPQQGHSNMSPVQQGFQYRPLYRGCEFVIVSNFYEFRLYNDNELDFERWTLDDLVDPKDDHIAFRIFYLLLCRENFVSVEGRTRTQRMLLDIRGKQEEIGRKFYADYKAARAGLISNLTLLNPNVQTDRELGIEKAQKIIDRIVFACFAEDRGLLPEKTIARVLKDAAESSFGSLWSTFRGFFEAVDRGSDKLGISIGYNGGLFAQDAILDALVVGDNALRAVANLHNYNFVEDLSVSILGHIFEQSISDLEEIRSTPGDVAPSRRKKDGIYYTPDHVVRFIVDNSLGEHLRKVERDLLESAGLKPTVTDATYVARERAAYAAYQHYLQNVRVLDPSCGSGAFLVQAYDYLIAENNRVGEILGNDVFSSDSFVELILRQNLYGVDLNEESVEITKLSLWLKSAKKGRQLTTLDANIRCGDSLIEDELVAGTHAFAWSSEFAAILAEGGFDVVIGNPPYVDSEVMVSTAPGARTHIAKSFTSAKGNWDLFVPFYQRAFDLTKAGGVCSMIVPNKILGADYASALRTYIDTFGHLRSLVDVSRDQIFDVDVYPVIVTTIHETSDRPVKVQVGISSSATVGMVSVPSTHNWAEMFADEETESFPATGVKLLDHFDVFSAASVAEAYELKVVIRNDPAATHRRVVNTGTIDPYWLDWGLWPTTYIKGQYLYPVAPPYGDRTKVWESEDKAIVAGMAKTIEAALSNGNEYLPAKSTVVVTRKGQSGLSARVALALLNSVAFRNRFVASNRFNAMAGGFMTVSRTNLGLVDIPRELSSKAEVLESAVADILASTETVRAATIEFKSILQSEFGDECWSSRLKGWWTMDAATFTKALRVEMSIEKRREVLYLHKTMAAELESPFVIMKAKRSEINRVISQLYDAEAS